MDLTGILSKAGIRPVRSAHGEVFALCPNPKHDDHRPSWSINEQTGKHHCFSCGYSGSLTSLLLDVTGSAPEDLEKTLNTESFLRKMQDVRREPEQALAPVIPTLTEWALANIMIDVPTRLLEFRHLQREAIDQYQVRWDSEQKRWVLPLRSPSGELLGAQYRQKGSVFTLPEGMEKSKTFFGFAQCCDSSFCALVESPLDAVRLAGLGIPALSSLGAWVSKDQIRILATHFTRVYLAFDNDRAGRQSAEVVAPMLRRAGTAPLPWSYVGLVDGEGNPAKDPGDVADDSLLAASWHRTLRMGL